MCFAFIGYSQEYSADSSYTTFNSQVSGGTRYFSRPISTPSNTQITISATVIADTLVGGISLWITTDGSTWKQWKASEMYPYPAVTTQDTLVMANSATPVTYTKHWVFPATYFNGWRVSYYSGASGTGAATNTNTIKTRYTLKTIYK